MADPTVTLVVAEGNRVIHEGAVLEAGESFEIAPKAAEALVANGGCELSEDAPKSRSRSRKAAEDAPADAE